MLRFLNISIKRKLMLVIMLTSTTALLLAILAVATFSWRVVQRALVDDLEAVADIVGANSTAAISFHDEEAAQETLTSVKVRPEIVSAQIYDRKGNVLANYRRAGTSLGGNGSEAEPAASAPARYLNIIRPVTLDGEVVGTVHLQADLQQRQARLKVLTTVAAVSVLASWLVALALSTYLQRVISAPILSLANMALAVEERKDYSLRAKRQSSDEIGVLVDRFNQMLAQVQSRDEELRTSEERFRQLAENFSEVFWMSDLEKKQIIYVSPAYANVWGRSTESLQADPSSWMEAIHPDDRDHVRRAALTKQAGGEYDEVYRITRPSGVTCWIRDRAYPVRDGTGRVYRIVGIAEDITALKQAQGSEHFLGEITNNMEEGVSVVKAADTTIVYANRKLEHMFGFDPREMEGRPFRFGNTALNENRPGATSEILAELNQTGFWSGEIYTCRKDGTPFWCSVHISTFQHPEHGKVWIAVHSDITDRKRMEEEILNISDRERHRIGQDIHDGLCQLLTGTAFATWAVEHALREGESPQAADVRKIALLIDQAITEARNVARGLSPVELEPQGLMAALEQLTSSVSHTFGVNCVFSCRQPVSLQNNALSVQMYRIAQEAVNNAVKHARPRHITVALTVVKGRITLTVEDDGMGIAEVREPNKGMGLRIMSYRASVIGGLLEVHRQEEGGTIVTCSVEDSPPHGQKPVLS